jgi:dTDP-4-dehydrorhamnose reductase
MAQRIAARFGFAKELVLAQAVATAAGRAARPRDVALRNAKAGAELETPMRTLDEGLSLILKMSETPVL